MVSGLLQQVEFKALSDEDVVARVPAGAKEKRRPL